MKLLVAEDSSFALKLIENHLTGWGHEIVSVNNGYDAILEMQKKDSPKLALLDWIMPRVHGADVCKVIRKIDFDVRPYLIIVSRKPQVKDIVEALEAGADDYLTKPYVAIELKARLDVGIRIVETEIKLCKKIMELEKADSKLENLKAEN